MMMATKPPDRTRMPAKKPRWDFCRIGVWAFSSATTDQPRTTSLSFVNPLTPTVAIRVQHQSAQMSKITNDGLTRSGAGCFIHVAVLVRQQWASKARVNVRLMFRDRTVFSALTLFIRLQQWSNNKPIICVSAEGRTGRVWYRSWQTELGCGRGSECGVMCSLAHQSLRPQPSTWWPVCPSLSDCTQARTGTETATPSRWGNPTPCSRPSLYRLHTQTYCTYSQCVTIAPLTTAETVQNSAERRQCWTRYGTMTCKVNKQKLKLQKQRAQKSGTDRNNRHAG